MRHEKRRIWGYVRARQGQRFSRSKIIMSNGRSVSSRFLYLSFRFHAAATKRHATSYRAQMSAMFRLVDASPRRMSRAHAQNPDLLHHPGATGRYCCPEISRRSRVCGQGGTLNSTIRCCEHNTNPVEVIQGPNIARRTSCTLRSSWSSLFLSFTALPLLFEIINWRVDTFAAVSYGIRTFFHDTHNSI